MNFPKFHRKCLPNRKSTVDLLAVATLSIFMLLFESCTSQRQDLQPHYKLMDRVDSIETIFIMPPSVDLTLKSIGGTEKWTPKCDQAEIDLANVIARELTRRGFRVSIIPKNEGSTGNNDGKSEILESPNSRSEGTTLGSDQETNDSTPGSLELKDIASGSSHLKTNAQLFVTLKGFSRSGGDIAAEVATKTLVSLATMGLVTRYADSTGSAMLTLQLVDKDSGELLWANQAGKGYYLTGPNFGEKDLVELITILLKNFPPKA
jgi:hypothetical protein